MMQQRSRKASRNIGLAVIVSARALKVDGSSLRVFVHQGGIAHLPKNASGVTSLALPAASIFTIDKQAEKLVSVHNIFDIAKVYAAVQCST